METKQPIYQINPNSIVVPEKRQRRKIDRSALAKLRESIDSIGQLQPGTCSKEGDKIILIAGHRRLLACKELEIPYQYVLVAEIPDPLKRATMELHENIIREDLDFVEEAMAKQKLHELFCEMNQSSAPAKKGWNKSWTIEQTATELSVSKGNLVEDIKLAKYAEKIPEVRNARNKSEAKKIIKRLESGVIRSEALRQAVEKAQKTQPEAKLSNAGKATVEQKLAEDIKTYSSKIFCGEMEEKLSSLEEELFDIVFFDPPWGVGFHKSIGHSGSTKKYDDEIDKFFETLFERLALIYAAMKEDSHLFLKFGIVHHGFVYETLQRVGFEVNGIPLIWLKKGQHRTEHPDKWHGRCYEPIAFARKGNKRLIQIGQPNIIVTKPPSPKMKQDHPSAMHPDLVRQLLLISAKPGDRILDPMAGSCMTAVAAESLEKSHALDWFMIEKEQTFCDLGIKNLLKGYKRIVGEIEVDLERDEKDFTKCAPGSPEWKNIWGKFPELRPEMIKFAGGES